MYKQWKENNQIIKLMSIDTSLRSPLIQPGKDSRIQEVDSNLYMLQNHSNSDESSIAVGNDHFNYSQGELNAFKIFKSLANRTFLSQNLTSNNLENTLIVPTITGRSRSWGDSYEHRRTDSSSSLTNLSRIISSSRRSLGQRLSTNVYFKPRRPSLMEEISDERYAAEIIPDTDPRL